MQPAFVFNFISGASFRTQANALVLPLRSQVTVAVLDRNDSPPSFRGSPLSFLVSEELAVGQAVATLAATDADSIGELSYVLVEDATTAAASPFTLDGRTGVIRLRDALDREAQDSYRLPVRASDGVQTTDAYVTIQVKPALWPVQPAGGRTCC